MMEVRNTKTPVLTWVAGGVAALSLLLLIIPAAKNAKTPEAVSAVVGVWFATFLIAAFLALIAYLISRRSSRIGHIVFITIMACLVSMRIYSSITRQSDKLSPQGEQTFRKLIAMNEAVLNDAAAGKLPDPSAVAREVTQTVDAAAPHLSEFEVTLFRTTAELLQDMSAATLLYQTPLRRFIDAGSFDAASIDSQATLKQRIAMMDATLLGLADAERHYRIIVDDAENRFLRAGLSPRLSKSNAQSLVGNAGMQFQLYANQNRCCQAIRDLLVHLDTTWGSWSVEDSQLVFQDDAAAETFNQTIERIQRETAEETRLLEQARRRLPK